MCMPVPTQALQAGDHHVQQCIEDTKQTSKYQVRKLALSTVEYNCAIVVAPCLAVIQRAGGTRAHLQAFEAGGGGSIAEAGRLKAEAQAQARALKEARKKANEEASTSAPSSTLVAGGKDPRLQPPTPEDRGPQFKPGAATWNTDDPSQVGCLPRQMVLRCVLQLRRPDSSNVYASSPLSQCLESKSAQCCLLKTSAKAKPGVGSAPWQLLKMGAQSAATV